MKIKALFGLTALLLQCCVNKNNEFKKEDFEFSEGLITLCNENKISTINNVTVLYIPFTMCTACVGGTNKAIENDSSSIVYVLKHESSECIESSKKVINCYTYKSRRPGELGLIDPYPILFHIKDNQVLDYQAIL